MYLMAALTRMGFVLCLASALSGGVALQAFAQESTTAAHSGNKVRMTFAPDGRLGVIDTELGMEWPVGTGQEYLDTAFPTVTIGGQLVSFGATRSTIPMSHRSSTWPSAWNNRWNGFFGTGRLTADQESLVILEAADSPLRLSARGWQWSHYLAQDMLLMHYTLENTGSTDLAGVRMGFVVDPAVGGDNGLDLARFDQHLSSAVMTDPDGTGQGRAVAVGIGSWFDVGQLSLMILETPASAFDGVDNDGDGLVDESRTDGIDNDGDWDPLLHDVGVDGRPGTGDEGEADGIPTSGEPKFDLTDPDESDQIGVGSFVILGGQTDDESAIAAAMVAARFDQEGEASGIVVGTGEFSIPVGDVQYFAVVLFLSANDTDRSRNEAVAIEIGERGYAYPIAPARPVVRAVAEDGQVTLSWDDRAESAPDFEGYKVFKSTDPGFNDAYTVTDDRGTLIYSEPEATFDLKNEVSRLFGIESGGFRYFLGRNSGITHWWTDTNVANGRTYYYAVVAFDRGDSLIPDFPTESTKSIVVWADGQIETDDNTVVVTPTVEASGYIEPTFVFEHTSGPSTGIVSAIIIDRSQVRDARYELTFSVDESGNSIYSLTDLSFGAVFLDSRNFSSEAIRSEGDPQFDGVRIFVQDDVLRWDSTATGWATGNSNWSVSMRLNANLGPPVPVPADYEVRFGDSDTAIFTTPFEVPFQVWNTSDNRKENILVLDQNGDGGWSSGEPIFVVEGSTLQDFRPIHWTITLTEPSDPAVTSVAPQSGDVAFLTTTKPFSVSDIYTLDTASAAIDGSLDASALDDIAVVPNPYIINSGTAQRALITGGRSIRRLQFIHLPERCTIRIFDLRGRLVDVIEHDGGINSGSEFWDLQPLGAESDVIAAGIYIYHVEAPGLGQKIGRFAVIR